MKYREFKSKFRKFPVISSSHIYNVAHNPQVLKNHLVRWQKMGLVLKLKRGLYILNEEDREITPSRLFLANLLYSPSYVSLEYALGFYGLIPEKVEDLTSVTTKKTIIFKNAFGVFRYQHLKDGLFFGFKEIKDENNFPIIIAEPEKAVLDFIYLNMENFKNKEADIFILSYRFQNLESLRRKMLKDFSKRYENAVVSYATEELLNLIKRNKRNAGTY